MTRERDAATRRRGLGKKANTYHKLFGANTAVIIEDDGEFFFIYLRSQFPT